MSNKRKSSSFIYCCLAAWFCFVQAGLQAKGMHMVQTEQVNVAEGKDFRIKVDIVQPHRTTDGDLLYLISYSYNFKGRKTVSIKGVGTVPAAGKQQHFVAGEVLEFTDSDGRLLAKVQLQPNRRQPEGGALEIPKDNEFAQFLSDTTRDQAAFLSKAMQTLNKWFPSGYTIRQEGQVTSFVTAYRHVEGLPANVRGEIAVRLSYPFDPNRDQFFFRVYMLPRQYRSKSDHAEAPTPATQQVFEAFVKKLLQDLKQ